MNTSARLSENIVCAACGEQTPREGNDWPSKTGYYRNDADQQIRICPECAKLGHTIEGNQLVYSPSTKPANEAPGAGSGEEGDQATPNVMVAHLGTTPLRTRHYNRRVR